MVLASERLWADAVGVSSPIISSFRRLYQHPAPLSGSLDQITYLEPDIAGTVLAPAGIKLVIGA